jgi:hypothetical protein
MEAFEWSLSIQHCRSNKVWLLAICKVTWPVKSVTWPNRRASPVGSDVSLPQSYQWSVTTGGVPRHFDLLSLSSGLKAVVVVRRTILQYYTSYFLQNYSAVTILRLSHKSEAHSEGEFLHIKLQFLHLYFHNYSILVRICFSGKKKTPCIQKHAKVKKCAVFWATEG